MENIIKKNSVKLIHFIFKSFFWPIVMYLSPNQIFFFFYSTVSGRDYRPSSQTVARRAKYLQRVLHATNRVFQVVQFKCEVQ